MVPFLCLCISCHSQGGGAGQEKCPEQGSTETLSVSAALCLFLGFHHKAATLRLFTGLRLIYCLFLSLCNALQEPPEATSDPGGDEMHRSGTSSVVPDVPCGQQQTFPYPLLLWNSFLQAWEQHSQILQSALEKLWLGCGEVAPPAAQAPRQLDLITLLKTGKILARFAPKLLLMSPLV